MKSRPYRRKATLSPGASPLEDLAPGQLVRWKAARAGGVWEVSKVRTNRQRHTEVDVVFPATGLFCIITERNRRAWEILPPSP